MSCTCYDIYLCLIVLPTLKAWPFLWFIYKTFVDDIFDGLWAYAYCSNIHWTATFVNHMSCIHYITGSWSWKVSKQISSFWSAWYHGSVNGVHEYHYSPVELFCSEVLHGIYAANDVSMFKVGYTKTPNAGFLYSNKRANLCGLVIIQLCIIDFITDKIVHFGLLGRALCFHFSQFMQFEDTAEFLCTLLLPVQSYTSRFTAICICHLSLISRS